MENANDIIKLVYTVTRFDLRAMQAHEPFIQKRIYEIYPDGSVTRRYKVKGNRKTLEKDESHTATKEDYRQLCEQLNQLINTADRLIEITDDVGAELRIYRPFGRVDTLPRGYGNADKIIGNLLSDYLYHKAGF